MYVCMLVCMYVCMHVCMHVFCLFAYLLFIYLFILVSSSFINQRCKALFVWSPDPLIRLHFIATPLCRI